MSGGSSAVMAAAAVAGAVMAYNNGQEQKKAAQNALNMAKSGAEKQAAQADQEFNRVNQKRPDTSAILSAAQQSGKSGVSSTMLTGPQGVDTSALKLGKSTLLGM